MREKGKGMARLKVRLALKWFTRSGVQDKVWRAFATQETSAYQAGNPPTDTPPAAQENAQLKRTNKRCVECNVSFYPPRSLSWSILPWTPVLFELWTANLPGGSKLQTRRKIDAAVIDKFPAGARLLSLLAASLRWNRASSERVLKCASRCVLVGSSGRFSCDWTLNS